MYQNLTIFRFVSHPLHVEARSLVRNSSFQPARLNLLRRETLELSFCIRFKAMWRRIARLYALLSLRFLAWSSFMTALRTQCRWFSTPQCERATWPRRSDDSAALSR